MSDSQDRYFVASVPVSEELSLAIHTEATDRSCYGLHLIEACGDENRQPSLIFERGDKRQEEYLVELIPSAKNQNDTSVMTAVLDKFNSLGWKLITVLDRPLARPLAIFRKVNSEPADSQLSVVIVPSPRTVAKEILSSIKWYESTHGCRLRTALHTGISPVLIFGETEALHYEYVVTHTPRPQEGESLHEAIMDSVEAFALSGCELCAAFEDERLTPCLIFRRPA